MTTEKTATALSGLAAQSAGADRSEAEILKAAHERLAVVQDQIAELQKSAVTVEEAGESYQAAIAERAHLDLVISRSRAPA